MNRERRFLNAEVSLDAKSPSPKITGYAAKFGVRADLGKFVEQIDPHAFDDCVTDPAFDCVGLWNHDDNHILGRTTSGTMNVTVDGIGLKYEIDPPATTVAKDLLISLERRDVTKSSFGFFAVKDTWEPMSDGRLLRTILKAEVFDVSPVTFAAYDDATAGLRSLFPDAKGKLPEHIERKISEVRATKHPRGERRFRNIVSAVSSTPWAILPEKLETICALLDARAKGIVATKEEIQSLMMGSDENGVTDNSQTGVAVIPILGPISQRMDLFTEICGGASCEGLTKQFRAALNDDSVSAIIFDIDSPGGTVTGVPELGAEILGARGKKPIIAVANGMAASAAYWIAAAADKIIVTPSGQVGSVGVYCTHQDLSVALEKEGVAVTFIQAGKYKTDGNPYEPLSESAREEMQKSVNDFYEMFTAAVGAGRGVSADVVKANYGQGRMFHAEDAVAAGMADQIATLDEAIAQLLAPPSATDVIAAAVSEASTSTEVVVETVVADVQDDGDPDDMAGQCECECDACQQGNCGDCSDPDCDDDFCMDCGDVAKVTTQEPVAEEFITEDETEILRKRVRVAQADV